MKLQLIEGENLEFSVNDWEAIGLGAVIITFGALIVLLSVWHRRAKARRAVEEQKERDRSIILNLYNKLSSNEINIYKELPSSEARLNWLTENHPEFMEAVSRLYVEPESDFAVASDLDFRLVRAYTTSYDRNAAIRRYINTARAMSLNEYQVLLDEQREAERQEEQRLAKELAKRRAKAAAERALQEKAAKKYWKSLSPTQKETFKAAKGKAQRKNALPNPPSDFTVEVLYPLIMATQFSNIHDTNYSINQCESTPSGGFGGGGHGGHETGGGGGGYSDGGSPASSDGGGASGGGE